MKNAKKYENINWKECYVTFFHLQNKTLKAFKNGSLKGVTEDQHALTRVVL